MKQCTKCGKWKPLLEFSGRPASRDGLALQCRACRRVYDKRYREEHKDAIATYEKHRYDDDGRREERAAYMKHWYVEHKEERRETYAANLRAWRRNNPAKRAAQKRRRRAHKNGAEGQYTAEEFEALCAGVAWKCLRCGMPHDVRPLTADHIIALSKGGADDISNIQPLCRNCNSRKGVQTIDYWQDPWWACCT